MILLLIWTLGNMYFHNTLTEHENFHLVQTYTNTNLQH